MDEKNMKDICFITNMYPKETEEFYNSYVIRLRGNNITHIQNLLIKGFDFVYERPVHIINKMLLSFYPKGYKRPWIKKQIINIILKNKFQILILDTLI